MNLFDQLDEAERRKELGMSMAARTSEDWLYWARRNAVRLSCRNGSVSAADIRYLCEEHNYWPPSENAWGSLFRAPGWNHVGYTKARHVKGHARDVKVWKYVGTRAHLSK